MTRMIGLSCYRLAPGRVSGWTSPGHGVPDAYVSAVRRAGGRPVLLAAEDGVEVGPGSLDGIHGLILTGGGDIDPSWFGAQRHPAVYGVDDVRDSSELALAKAALDAGVPLLAICRGMQVLNVALGGTLVQHLGDLPGLLAHGRVPNTDPDAPPGPSAVHPVDVVHGTALAAVGGHRFEHCESHHHQAVDVVAPGLVVSGRSPDGVVEAVETVAGQGNWCVAVQWHPERTAHADPAQQALFDSLVAAATQQPRAPSVPSIG